MKEEVTKEGIPRQDKSISGSKEKKWGIREKGYKKEWVGKRGRGIEVTHLDLKQGEKEKGSGRVGVMV